MKLFENKETFYELIETVASKTGFSSAQIEKDYYVSLFLEELAKRAPNLLFKGGTSLSKCHKAIDRFSEDIDLTLEEHHQGRGERRKAKYAIFDACETLGFKLLNPGEIKSHRNYNAYYIEYPLNYPAIDLKPTLKAETVFIQKAYPDEIKPVSSILFEYLKGSGNDAFISAYQELEPFPIRVQTIERTFVDKVFAICDYAISGETKRNSRHIYDLYRLWPMINIGSKLKALAKDVRRDRQANRRCHSAAEGVDVEQILREILSSRIYEDDYETITKAMIYKEKYIPYEEASTVLGKIIDKGTFQKEGYSKGE